MRLGITIVGAGGLGREVLAALMAAGERPVGFLVEPGHATAPVCGLPVRDDDDAWASPGAVVVAIGDGAARRRIAQRIGSGRPFATVLHPRASIGPRVAVGEGALLIGPLNATTDVRIGAHALLNPGCLVAHDCAVGPFASLGPGVKLAGAAVVGEGASIGTGAVIGPGCEVGAWSVVGAGAVVLRDVPPGARVAGVPARALPPRSA